MRYPTLVFLLLSFVPSVVAQVCAPPPAAQLWSDPTTWPNSTPPGPGDDVEIPAGTIRFVDISPPELGEVTVHGRLVFDCAALDFTVARVDVMPGGTFEAGLPDRANTGQVTITLTGEVAREQRALVVHGGGRLELHGIDRGSPWVHLDQTALSGTSLLHLALPMPEWPVGARVVVTSTDYDMDQAEERSVTAVQNGGSILVLDAPLRFTHWGSFEAGSIDHRAQVALIDRNIIVQGDSQSPSTRRGGHMMFTSENSVPPIVHMDWVRVRRCGWRKVLARYPIHFHLCRSVLGSYVRDCMIDEGYHRSVTVHGTDDLQVVGNVSYGAHGHAFYLEDGTEVRNEFRGNLGLGTRAIPENQAMVSTDERPGTFYSQNNENIFVGNVAAGSEGSGFYVKLAPELLGDPSIGVYAVPPTFVDNVAHSNLYYGFYGDEPVHYDPNDPAVFVDFHAHHNSRSGVWSRSHGVAHWTGLRVSDNATGAYLASGGWVMFDRKSLVRLERSILVGESENIGNPSTPAELAHGRSLPLPTDERPIHDLVGVEIYDGLLEVRDCTFMNYQDAVIAGVPRHAGALSQVFYASPWQVDPRNSIESCAFVQAVPVYFRDGLIDLPFPRDNGVRHTTLWDLDGCVTGLPDSTVFANNPFLVPPTGARFEPAFNAWVLTGPEPSERFAQLHLQDGSSDGPILGPQSPLWIRLKRGFSGLPGGASTTVLGNINKLKTARAFPLNLLVGGEYKVKLPSGTRLRDYVVSLRFARPRDSVLLELKYAGGGPSSVEKSFDHIDAPTVPAVAAASLDDLRVSAADYFFDAATQRLYLKPTLGVSPVNPSGTSRLDGSMVFLIVRQ